MLAGHDSCNFRHWDDRQNAHLHDAGEGERRPRQARAVHQRDRRAPVAMAVEERTHNTAIYNACHGPPWASGTELISAHIQRAAAWQHLQHTPKTLDL